MKYGTCFFVGFIVTSLILFCSLFFYADKVFALFGLNAIRKDKYQKFELSKDSYIYQNDRIVGVLKKGCQILGDDINSNKFNLYIINDRANRVQFAKQGKSKKVSYSLKIIEKIN